MEKCDVCGKNSLLPEKFGSVNICKKCFLKANGILWKHQYEDYDNAEKKRCLALENAYNCNFSQPVISAINEFFISQMDRMLKCDCCGEPVLHRQQLGKANICKRCFNKINSATWKRNDYDDNESVEKDRQKVLCSSKNFPPIIIDEINAHFDSKIQKGLVCTINGGKGQKLRVFETYCLLITSDNFNTEEISVEYGRALKKSQPKESILSDGTVKSLAYSALTGGLVHTGIKLATSAAVNAVADTLASPKGVFKVVKGIFKIDYRFYDYVDYQPRGENEVGFIRFRNGMLKDNPAEDVVFFFNTHFKIEKIYNIIYNGITLSRQQQMNINQQPTQEIPVSSADEIMKFKKLLDMGAITQDEYDAKKKELLSI